MTLIVSKDLFLAGVSGPGMPSFRPLGVGLAWLAFSILLTIGTLLDIDIRYRYLLVLGSNVLYWLWKLVQWGMVFDKAGLARNSLDLFIHPVFDFLGLISSSLLIGLLRPRVNGMLVSLNAAF
jgi:hypothetical protein